MNRRRTVLGVVTLGLLLALAAGPGSISTPLWAGFDGDGYDDLVIGVPNDKVASYRPGAVAVLYGGPYPGLSGGNGLRTQPNLLPDNDDDQDLFGQALAAGDFDGDGYYDLATGVPHEDLWSITNCGAVTVIYGSALGLSSRSQLWYQNLLNDAEAGDRFGSALAAGDFNGDGYDDLAVGVPEEDLGSKGDAGEVNVYYGTASGLSGTGRQVWHQDNLGVNWGAATGDKFGSVLATGDFDDDGFDDLAVGVPNEDSLVAIDIGVVNVVYGSATGLKSARSQQWHQDVPDILNGADPGDKFGYSLATGDLNGDGYTDLAVGVPYEEDGAIANAGAVSVVYGSASGLAADGNEFWQQKIGNSDAAEADDRFGWALAVGNFDGDRYADLAMGAPYEDVGAKANAGAVSVVYGSAAGLTSKYGWWFHQDLLDPTDTAESGDTFGWALAAGDLDGNGCDDLAVGVPHEDIGAWPGDNGLVNVVYGTRNGLGAGGPPDQLWWQGGPDMAGSPSEQDHFGWALASIPSRRYGIYLPLIERNS